MLRRGVVACLAAALLSAGDLSAEAGAAEQRKEFLQKRPAASEEGQKPRALTASPPDAQADGLEAVKAWARQRITEAEAAFNASGLRREASPLTWAGVVVYEIFVDRFNNGNLSNDALSMPQVQVDQMARGDLSSMPGWRHGGDLQGIRDRLGYLAELGVQALWVTPVLKSDGSYHGYCLTDPTTTDPSFGTPEELRDLVADAHQHGIAVVLDIVINHMCDPDTHYVEIPDHQACSASLDGRYWAGEPGSSPAQGTLNFSSSFFPPFRTPAFFNRCGPNSEDDTNGLGPEAIFGDFATVMFDFNTLDDDFQELFTDMMKYWIAFADLDGFRLDAAKHVTNDFLAYFSAELRAYALTLGKANFLTIGEVAAIDETWKARSLGRMMSDPEDPTRHGKIPQAQSTRLLDLKSVYTADEDFAAPGLMSLYNFNLSWAGRNALRCQSPSKDVGDYFTSSAYSTLMESSVAQHGAERDSHLWTAIELHDWPRFLGLQPHQADVLMTPLAWLLTSPGAPILYYGVEQGFNGKCPEQIDAGAATSSIRALCNTTADAELSMFYGQHPDELKRQDMFVSGPFRLGSAVEELDRLAYVGGTTPALSKPWQSDEMLPRDHTMFTFTRGLVALRRSCPALAVGAIKFHVAAPVDCGLLAYSRFINSTGLATDEIIVILSPAINPHPEEVSAETLVLQGDMGRKEGQWYVNALDPRQRAQLRAVEGQQHLVFQDFVVKPGAIMIFIQQDRMMPFNETLGVALCRNNA